MEQELTAGRCMYVVDLLPQHDAIQHAIVGWPPARVVEWLGQYGEVDVIEVLDDLPCAPYYILRAPSGLTAAFWFTPDGALQVPPRSH